MTLDAFKKFSTYQEPVIRKEEVWSYSRVSSKEQFNSNNSLLNQKNYAHTFVKDNNYDLTFEFGGTYESAKGDFTRKEFKNMIAQVRAAKKKPYAILIFKMSRFSRSGSGGISVVHELVDVLGVHLIETSTGLATDTPRGKNTIITKLAEAERENIERLEITVPGMVNFMKAGNWLGNAPLGYEHHGPRVKDMSLYSAKQELVISADGKLLKKAWKWKLEGQRDYEIIDRLALLGLTITKQKLSYMWRKPFYCGINTNRMLKGEVAIGNWEKMVSQSDFLRVQEIIGRNHVGYEVASINEKRPLTGFVICSCCGKKLTSYEVKARGLHYYTCQGKCEGSTMNAETTKKAMQPGVNNLFIDLLERYQLDENLAELFKKQLSFTIGAFNSDNSDDERILNESVSQLESKKESLERKHIFEDLPKATYEKYMAEIETEISAKNSELQKLGRKISNVEKMVDKCATVALNLSRYWTSGNINKKLHIQKMLFPDGLVMNTKKREYLTSNVNRIFLGIAALSSETEGQKKDSKSVMPLESFSVAGTRLERATFGL